MPDQTIIVDTSGFYALVVANDRFHQQARAVFASLIAGRSRLTTTSYILSETAALIQRRIGMEALQELSRSYLLNVEVHWIDQSIHEEAWRRMMDRGSREISLVDWSTIVTAQRIGATIFAFDSDFANEGVATVPTVVEPLP